MKIISYGTNLTAQKVPANTSRNFTVKVEAGDEDLAVTYVVVLGYDDLSDIHGPHHMMARIFTCLEEENVALRKRAAEADLLEKLLVKKSQTPS